MGETQASHYMDGTWINYFMLRIFYFFLCFIISHFYKEKMAQINQLNYKLLFQKAPNLLLISEVW